MQLPFIKMNGSGNDFVVFDGRRERVTLSAAQLRAISDRANPHTKGCDQVIVMESSKNADIFMRIFNADGSQVDACGNATRCVASLIEEELQRLPVSIETNAGILHGLQKAYTPDEKEYILVDMGAPKLGWQDIPLALPPEQATEKITALTGFTHPSFVSMGNPHLVFFLRFAPADHATRDDAPLFDIALDSIGPQLEKNKDIFPQGVNVSIALLRAASDGQGHIVNARVWERGAGLTQACGTAACAMLVAANGRDASVKNAHIWFEPFGTSVTVRLDENGHVLLGGPVEIESRGMLEL